MNRIDTTVALAKNFVRRHQTKLAVAATATVALVIHNKAKEQHDEFLKEHGLYEKFYTPEEA